MKGFQKLALAAAIAAAPFAAQAELTAMDDALLSEMTGQAGVTIDLNLDVKIAEIRYADEDGVGTDIGDGGYLTLANIKIFGDQGDNGTDDNGDPIGPNQAIIRGVTIDVDGAEGIVIGLGEIGGTSNLSTQVATVDLSTDAQGDPTGLTATATGAQAAVLTSNYWTGVNVTADLGINGTSAGSIEVKNFTNFVPNALAVEAVQKFGYDFIDTTGAVTGTPGTATGAGTAVALVADTTGANLGAIATATNATTGLIVQEYTALKTAGTLGADATDQEYYDFAKARVVTNQDAATLAGSGENGFANALVAGTHIDASISIQAGGAEGEGLTISAVTGFVIEELSYSDDGLKMGIHNFVMFDTHETTGEVTGFTIDGLTIDVVNGSGADAWAPTNSSATAALKIAGLTTNGTIAIGDIFIGDHETGSLGAVSIRDIDMSNTEIFVYGH